MRARILGSLVWGKEAKSGVQRGGTSPRRGIGLVRGLGPILVLILVG